MREFAGISGATVLRAAHRRVARVGALPVAHAAGDVCVLIGDPLELFGHEPSEDADHALAAAMSDSAPELDLLVAPSRPRRRAGPSRPWSGAPPTDVQPPSAVVPTTERSRPASTTPRRATYADGGFIGATVTSRQDNADAFGKPADVPRRAADGIHASVDHASTPYLAGAEPPAGVDPATTPSEPTPMARFVGTGGRTPVRIPAADGRVDEPVRVATVAARSAAAPVAVQAGAVSAPAVQTPPGSTPDAPLAPPTTSLPGAVAAPSGLAGLTRWWNDSQPQPAATSPYSSAAAPADRIPAPPDATAEPRRGRPGVTDHDRDHLDPLDDVHHHTLRASFGGLLELALLDAARADGIEVRP